MLSLFPSLLAYEQLSPLILRVILGITVVYFGYRHTRRPSGGTNSKIQGILEIVIAAFVLVGLFTQAAALIIALALALKLIMKVRSRAFLTDGVNYYLLLLAIAISIMVTGPGWFAFDVPL